MGILTTLGSQGNQHGKMEGGGLSAAHGLSCKNCEISKDMSVAFLSGDMIFQTNTPVFYKDASGSSETENLTGSLNLSLLLEEGRTFFCYTAARR